METFIYDELVKREENDWWFVGRRKIILTLLNKYLVGQRNLSILDIGCGAGGMIEYLSNYGQVIGLDKDKHIVDLNLKKGKNVVCGDIKKLNFSNDSFDLITLLEILEHLDDDSSGLKEVFRVLKPQGILLVTVPAFPFLWSSHDSVAHHKRRYTKRELERKLSKSGFKILKISYMNIFLFPVIFLFRLFKNLFSREKNKSDFIDYPAFLNHLLKLVFSSEAFFLKTISFPFGVSLLVLAQKNE